MKTKYKGVVLAGGSGTRLHPITQGVSKHLLPIYDKPMIFYPISVLMLAGINEILLITTPEDVDAYKRLLGSGYKYGLNIEYAIQEKPNGIAEAFIIGEKFIGNNNVALILGDNIFYGHNFTSQLNKAVSRKNGSTVFGYEVKDPERYGVINFNKDGNAISIDEKPKNPKSNYAVTGLYFYDNKVLEVAKSIVPSERGELEITDINKNYLENDSLAVEILGRGFTWLDTGTHNSLIEANQFVQSVENSQGLKIACLEEIAYFNGWISKDQIIEQIESLKKSNYGQYLKKIVLNESH